MSARERDLATQNEELRQENEALRCEVETLSAKMAELEARLGRSSMNSSLPPSSDSSRSRAERRAAQHEATKSKRADAKRARGKQPGSPGATLMRRTDPTEVVVHEPECCSSCGKDLTDAPAEASAARQVYDTPDPVLLCTERRSVKKRCSCGAVSAGGFPPEARAPVPFGPNVRAAAL